MKTIRIPLNPEYTMDDLRSMSDRDICVLPIHIVCILTAVGMRLTAHEPYPKSHPLVLWASESQSNYEMLWNYGMDLLDVHHEKFGEPGRYKHGSANAMAKLGSIPARIPEGPETPLPQ